MSTDTMLYLLGIFIAALITQLAPFIRKFGTETAKWDNAYTLTFMISLVVSLTSTIVIYQMNPLNVVGEDIFVKGFALGLWNPVVTEICKHLMPQLFKEE